MIYQSYPPNAFLLHYHIDSKNPADQIPKKQYDFELNCIIFFERAKKQDSSEIVASALTEFEKKLENENEQLKLRITSLEDQQKSVDSIMKISAWAIAILAVGFAVYANQSTLISQVSVFNQTASCAWQNLPAENIFQGASWQNFRKCFSPPIS